METSKRYNSVSVKDNCVLFAPSPYFRAGLSDGVIYIFPLPTPVAMATNFGTKLTITRLPQKMIARCFHLPPIFGPGYAMVSCKFFPWRPLLSWQPTVFKTKLAAGSQERQTLNRSC